MITAASVLVSAATLVDLVVGGRPAAASPDGLVQIISLSGDDGSPSACQLAGIDLGAGGTVNPIGPVFDIAVDGCPFDMALRGATLYGVVGFGDGTTESLLVTIDPTSGGRTVVGGIGFATELAGLAFDEAGTLWLYAQNADPACAGGAGQACLYRLDPATGAATLVGTAPPQAQILGATATCDAVVGNQFVSTDQAPFGRFTVIDTASAALTNAPDPYGGGVLMTGIERDAGGVLHGVGFVIGEQGPGSPSTFTIDPTTGLASHVADPAVGPGQVLAALVITAVACDVPAPLTARVAFVG